MTNYILEGNLNFTEEINKLICKDNNNTITCLISGEELEDNHIKLDCKHCFNYEYILYELKNQRKKNRLETQKLSKNQIKCPYCRNIHRGILPYYEGYEKVKNVNVKHFTKTCIAKLKSGKRKGEGCGCKVKKGEYCGRHKQL